MEVAEHTDEHLLHEVFSPFAVADRSVDEIEEASLVAVDQGPERLGVARQMLQYQAPVVQLVQRPTFQCAGTHDGGRVPLEGCSHQAAPLVRIKHGT